jgi:hypothetical protein
MPQATSTAAACGLSGCGAGQSGGGAMAKTCASLRFARPGVTGSEAWTKMVHPEDAAARVTPKSAIASRFGVVMAQQDKREAHPPTIAIHGDIFASAKICRPSPAARKY